MSWETTWNVCFDSICININLMILSFVILLIGLYKRQKGAKTAFFSIAFLVALVGVAYWTLHARILQLIFPISLPENPFDSILIANYLATVALTFLFLPLLFLHFSHQLDAKKMGLRVEDVKYTMRMTFLGACVNLILVALPTLISILASWEYKWPVEYTTLGLALWFIFVTGIATWMQVLFFMGILFYNYVGSENTKLLFLISTLTFLMFTPLTRFTLLYVIGYGVEAYVTIRTRNIYGAMLIRSLGVALSTILVI